MLYAKEIPVRVNLNTYNEFKEKCDYLHNVKRLNCSYDISSSFQYIIKSFNEKYKAAQKQYWINEIELYDSRLKKDYQFCFSLPDYHYNLFVKNCKSLKFNRSKVIRSLMLKLIEQTQIE